MVKYKNKKTNKVYIINTTAICQDRNIEVVIYTDYPRENELFTMTKDKFFKEYELVNERVLFKCTYNDIHKDTYMTY